jgi:hypothetical protein
MSASNTYAWSFYLQVSDITGGIGFWLFGLATTGLWLINWPAELHFALSFPTPATIIQRKRWIIPVLYLVSFAIFIFGMAWMRMIEENVLLWLNYRSILESSIAGIFLAISILTIFLRYRFYMSQLDRAKMRWVVFGGLVSGMISLVFWIVLPLIQGGRVLSPNLFGLLLLPYPVSLAIAIVRHRLFDIDVIIRRTLIYGLLTSVLIGIYFASVIALQEVITRITGESSPLAIVGSTLAIAALFNPLRRWIQDFIDRRFYRRKFNADQIQASFARIARDEVDLEVLSERLVQVVHETMQPSSIHLWLLKENLERLRRSKEIQNTLPVERYS